MRQKCMLDTSFLYKLFVEKKVEILDVMENIKFTQFLMSWKNSVIKS